MTNAPPSATAAETAGARTDLAPARPEGRGAAAPRFFEPSRHRSGLVFLALGAVALNLLVPLSSVGIAEPHELEVAELGRRIALNLFGAVDLALPDGDNRVPILRELPQGELPFTSIAVGFKLFGLHDWAGRLPLALWALVGVAATYALLRVLANREAAAFSAVALATTPVYFLQARTMLGDIVAMACSAVAACGLLLAAWGGVAPRPLGSAGRVIALVVGVAGLAGGLLSRGLLLGVSLPLLAVGLTWLVLRWSSGLRPEHGRAASLLGALALAVGAATAAIGFWLLARGLDTGVEYSRWMGTRIEPTAELPTHDSVIKHVGHSLLPYSAVLPFAFAALLLPGAAKARLGAEQVLRAFLIAIVSVGALWLGLMAPAVGTVPFVPVFAGAAAVALMIADIDLGGRASLVVAFGVCALAVLVCLDYVELPESALAPFAVPDVAFPTGFSDVSERLLLGTAALCFGVFLFSFAEPSRGAARFQKSEYAGWFRSLRTELDGNLWFSLIVVEAALIVLRLVLWVSDRLLQIPSIESLGALPRRLVGVAWFALPLLVLLGPPLVLFVRDAFRLLYEGASGRFYDVLRPRRATGALLSLAGFGVFLSLWYYPRLSSRWSPKQVFTAYSTHAEEAEPLGTLGIGASAASYYAGPGVASFQGVPNAFDWLSRGEGRRWLLVRESDLARLNSLYRGKSVPPANLPVLDAHSSDIVLVSNRLEPGERNENPLTTRVSSQRPEPGRPLDVELGEELAVLGWDVRTPAGMPVDEVSPGVEYDFNIYFEVRRRVSTIWETFIHIDGYQRRYNGDHPTLGDRYPFSLWRPGDYLVDTHRFSFDPSFTPGTYNVFFGLFKGSRRLEVTKGPHDDNRIVAGTLAVR